jgi:hypothetical protein
MAKKKKAKKSRKREGVLSDGKVNKSAVRKENKQLIWFFVFVVVVFASFLIPYYYIQNYIKEKNSFEYAGMDWTIEDYKGLEIFHGRFPSFSGSEKVYNIYLRNDPRENNVSAEGKFNRFMRGMTVSFGEEIEQCRGDVSRVLVDFGAFLLGGIGVPKINPGTTSWDVANSSDLEYVDCSSNKAAIIIEKGVESWIAQSKINPECYTIKIKDCDDIKPLEKFMVKAVGDVGAIYK